MTARLVRVGLGDYENAEYRIVGRTRPSTPRTGADLSRRAYDGWAVYHQATGRMVAWTGTLAEARKFVERQS